MGRHATALLCAGIVLCAAAGAARADLGLLGVGPRALGKGGAYAAEAEGPLAPYWNPAGAGRRPGLHVELDFGLLPRPDAGQNEWGGTAQWLLGASWAPGGEGEDRPGAFGLALAVEKPMPRFDYFGSRILAPSGGSPRRVDVSVSQEYLEALACASLRAFDTELAGGRLALHAGLGIGLGLSDNTVRWNVFPALGGPSVDSDRYAGTGLALPGGLGLQAVFTADWVEASLAVRYRGVLDLSSHRVFSYPTQPGGLEASDLFLPPPQEGTVGVSAVFYERIAYSLGLTWCFFDAPDAFPDCVPHSYPLVRFGFEYRIPSEDGERQLDLRFGFAQSFPGSDKPASVHTAASTTLSLGFGLRLGALGRIDFYFAYLIPGEGDVDEDAVLGGLAYGKSF